MIRLRRLSLLLCATFGAWLSGLAPSQAQALLDESFLFGTSYQASEKRFDITAAGTYQFQLVDLLFPQQLLGVSGLVTRGNVAVATLRNVGVAEFQGAAGTHKLLIAPVPLTAADFGTFGASVVPATGGAPLVEHSDSAASVAATAPALQSTAQSKVTIASGGRYRVALADLGFPEPLAGLQLLLVRPDGTTAALLSGANAAADFDTVAGEHTLLVAIDAANAASAGLYSVTVSGLSGQGTPYASAQGAGLVTTGSDVTLPAAGAFTLDLTDLQTPRAFAELSAAVTQGGTLLARTAGGASASFSAAAGKGNVFIYRRPGGGQQTGASHVRIASAGAAVFEAIDVASPDLAAGVEAAFLVETQAATTGAHRAALVDFEFPAAIAQGALYVVQAGRVIGERTGRGTVDVQVVAGPWQAIAVVTPNAATRSSLVAVQLSQGASSTVLAEATRAIGINLQSRSVSATASGSYDLTVSDLAFPAQFGELALAVTRGDQRVAAVFGSGKVSFPVSAGAYAIHLLGRVGTGTQFGAYGLRLEPTPAPPAITFSASPVSVRRDETVTLTWSSTGASSCTASDGWSGARPTSGTATSAALASDTRFTLTCTGPGGQSTTRADVTVKAASSSGGGGAAGGALLALFALLLGAADRARQDGQRAGKVGSSR